MKVLLDKRPADNNNLKTFFALRLYPETNEEMGIMEWGLEVTGGPDRIGRVFNGTGDSTFHYVIPFKEKIEDRKELTEFLLDSNAIIPRYNI
jgi:hypothetical protein